MTQPAASACAMQPRGCRRNAGRASVRLSGTFSHLSMRHARMVCDPGSGVNTGGGAVNLPPPRVSADSVYFRTSLALPKTPGTASKLPSSPRAPRAQRRWWTPSLLLSAASTSTHNVDARLIRAPHRPLHTPHPDNPQPVLDSPEALTMSLPACFQRSLFWAPLVGHGHDVGHGSSASLFGRDGHCLSGK